jgi:opacity protein-like surface antigen
MRKCFLLSLLVFLPVLLVAQSSDEHPKADVFGGYSYLGGNVSFPGGWEVQGTGYFTRHFGVTADFSGHYSSESPASDPLVSDTRERIHTYLFGPTYTIRKGKHAIFAHALLGGAHSSSHFTLPITSFFPTITVTQVPVDNSASAFAMAIGGGVDLGVTKHLAVRVGQLDWLYTRFKANEVGVTGISDANRNYQSTFRYSGGVVFRF